ncbi:MAG TPA: DUF2310 family Zn-ribbon-containing protein, partial [Thermomicrobiales bacterium]|nr:DUF2310 family Zn-ribbon-containing protein [Thermomicrobiales bacterium]
MSIAQLCFDTPHSLDAASTAEAINGVLHAMRMNGQILGREHPLVERDGMVCCYVMVPENGAFSDLHYNVWVRRFLGRLHESGIHGPTVTFLSVDRGESEKTEAIPSSYVLYASHVSLESPLRSGNDFMPVPLYRVPPTRDGGYHDVILWQSDYQACDTLYMNDLTAVRAAYRELSTVTSSLTRQGRAICAHWTAAMGVPVFYNLLQGPTRNRRKQLERRCPECHSVWLLES